MAVKKVGPSEFLVIFRSGQQPGRARKVSGPGLIFALPFIEKTRRVRVGERSQKLPAIDSKFFSANLVEGTLRYEIVDAAKTIAVEDIDKAVLERAIKLLGEEIAGLSLAEVLLHHEDLQARMQSLLHIKTMSIGVKIIALELQGFCAHEHALRLIDYLLSRQMDEIYALVSFLA